jgi:general stress protein YciG
MTTETKTTEKKKLGFALMTPEQRSAISSKGGKAAHAYGVAHEFSAEEARSAGSLGGKASSAKARATK